MIVITAGRTSDIEDDFKTLFSEWAIHRFLYRVSDEGCLNSCELLMIKTKTSFASYCFKEIANNMKVRVSTVLETSDTNKL